MLALEKSSFRPRARLARVLLTALALSYASSAWAAPADADRAAARQLGYQGVEAYQAGDYKTAQDKLGRAFDVVKVPTLGLWLARALTKNGRWVEAAEVYREVSRLEISEGKVEAQQEAQQAAASELDELAAKIPAIVIMIEGAQANQVVVEIDGVQVPAELEAVVARCLRQEPADRFANVSELADALLAFAPARAHVHADRAAQLAGALRLARAGEVELRCQREQVGRVDVGVGLAHRGHQAEHGVDAGFAVRTFREVRRGAALGVGLFINAN